MTATRLVTNHRMGTPMDSLDAADDPTGGRSGDPPELAVASLATIVGVLLGPAPVRTGAAVDAALAAAFLARVAGAGHPSYAAAVALLDVRRMTPPPSSSTVSGGPSA